MYTTIISVEELRAGLSDSVIVDCRFELAAVARPEAGRQAYASGHIPGAFYAHLDEDLSGPITPQTGRHPLPDPATLAIKFGRWGIESSSQVVAYDGDTGMFASRLWWLLRWLGHRAVAVLDGGFKAWQAAGLPVETAAPEARSAKFVGHAHDEMVLTQGAVAEKVRRSDWRLLDARAPERFRGDVEPIDPIAGHIPGAHNHPFAWNLDASGKMLNPDALKERLGKSLGDTAAERTAMMCGSGVTACHNLLAMEVAGLGTPKLYAGSWSEWIRDPKNPVAKGDV